MRKGVKKPLSLTIVALVLAILGACSSTTRKADDTAPESGFAPESIMGYIVSMEFEAIQVGDEPPTTFASGTRFNETQYLENGRATLHRYTFDGDKGWEDWYRTYPRRWEYTVSAPNVAKVDVYTYVNDGSTPAKTVTLTFADETSGTWERQAHEADVRSWGRFTLRDASDEGSTGA